MDYGFIAYIFISIVIGLGSFKILSDMDRFWSAIISLILFTLIFFFFGSRWFKSDGTSFFRYEGAWPPMINMCPDYLVYFKNGQQDTCIDLVGVNRGGALKPWTKDDSAQNPPRDGAKYFPYVYRPGMPEDKLKQLCIAAQEAGLTWEGITNGDSCTFATKIEE
jgi:hypothetical protein